jgi:hypothetical protein
LRRFQNRALREETMLDRPNRLFICASTSLYAVDVNTRGVEL